MQLYESKLHDDLSYVDPSCVDPTMGTEGSSENNRRDTKSSGHPSSRPLRIGALSEVGQG